MKKHGLADQPLDLSVDPTAPPVTKIWERVTHLRRYFPKIGQRLARRICLVPPEARPQVGNTARGKVRS